MRTYTVQNTEGKVFQVDEDKISEAEKDGYFPLVSNGSQEHRVSFADLALAKKDGYNPVSESGISKTRSTALGLLQGSSLGTADEVEGGVLSFIDDLKQLASGSRVGPKPTYDEFGRVSNPEELTGTYRDHRDIARQRYLEAEEANPTSYAAGQIGGGIAASLVPGAMGVRGATAAGRAGLAAAEGGVAGAGLSEEEELSRVAKDAAQGAVLGALFQRGGELAGAGVAKTARAVGKKIPSADAVLKKIGRATANVSEEATEKYLKNPTNYQKSETLEELKDELDKILIQRQQGVEGLESQWQALKSEYDKLVDTEKSNLDDAFTAAKEKFGEAKQNFKISSTNMVSDLRTLRPSTEAVDNIETAIEALGEQVTKGSGFAFDVLDQEGVNISRDTVKNLITQAAKSLEVEGGPPLKNSPARKHYQALLDAAEDVGRLPDNLLGGSVKRIIQDLDDSINYIETVGGRSGRSNAATASIRHGLDQSLKGKSKAYEEVMSDVSRKTDLLSTLNKGFGTKEQIMNRIVELPNTPYKAVLLKRLSEETKTDVESLLHDYMASQRILKDPRRILELKKSLPEFSKLIDTQKKLSAIPGKTSDRSAAAAAKVDKATGLPDKIEKAQGAFEAAKQELKDLGLSERRSEAVVKAFERGTASIEDRRALEKIAPHLIEKLDRARVVGAFERGDTQGSRRTLLGALAGRAVGGALGAGAGYAMGDEVGAAAGGVAGFSADRYAGRVFKAILDGKIKIDKLTPDMKAQLLKFTDALESVGKKGSLSLVATQMAMSDREKSSEKGLLAAPKGLLKKESSARLRGPPKKEDEKKKKGLLSRSGS